MRTKKRPFAALILVLAVVAAACGSAGGDTTNTAAIGDGVTGSVRVSGSSTVEPITARVGEAFNAANPTVGITVEGPGTGDGFARFCAGETDVSDASRPIKDAEAETCAAAGIEYVELEIAFDGITVLTSPENDAVSCLDFNDIYALVGPESEGFSSWSDADDLGAELGASHAPYPDEALVITAPGEESGTYDTFIEFVIKDIAEERGQEVASRADYQASANDNVIIDNISGDPASLGWVGYAFYAENADVLKAIEIDGGDGCVAPSDAAIADGSYPLARPLFIYVSLNKLAENSALAPFVDYYLSDEGLSTVTEADYVSLPDDQVAETRTAWSDAK